LIPRLVIASRNPGKVREIEEILGSLGVAGEVVRGLDWGDVEETGETFEENALLKARAVCEATGLPAGRAGRGAPSRRGRCMLPLMGPCPPRRGEGLTACLAGGAGTSWEHRSRRHRPWVCARQAGSQNIPCGIGKMRV